MNRFTLFILLLLFYTLLKNLLSLFIEQLLLIGIKIIHKMFQEIILYFYYYKLFFYN